MPGMTAYVELSESKLVVLSIANMRRRSAPKSGTTMKDPLGSRITSCSWGQSWREGMVPGPLSWYWKTCIAFRPPDRRIFYVVTADVSLLAHQFLS